MEQGANLQEELFQISRKDRHRLVIQGDHEILVVVAVQCMGPRSLVILKERTEEVSYSVEKDYVDDSKSLLAEIKGEDIESNTSNSDHDEDKLEMV